MWLTALFLIKNLWNSRIHVESQIIDNEDSSITVTTKRDPDEFRECDDTSFPDWPLLSESGLYNALKCDVPLEETKFIVSSTNLLDYIKICIGCRANDDSTTHVQYYTRGAVCQFKFLCSNCEKRWEFCTLGTDSVRSWRNENAVLMSPILLTRSEPTKVKSYMDACNIVYPEVNSYFQSELIIPAVDFLWASEQKKQSDKCEQKEDEHFYEDGRGHVYLCEEDTTVDVPSVPNNPKKELLNMIENFKMVYLETGAENYKSHQPYLKKLADYYCHKYSERIKSEPGEACWIDLFKAFTLYNSSAVDNEDDSLNEDAWAVVERFLGDNKNTDQQMFYSTVKMLRKQLEEARSYLRQEVNELDRKLGGSAFKYHKEMRAIIVNSNRLMVEFSRRIFAEAVNCMEGKPPCDFSVVGIGYIGRGEATPFSDLEYIFLLKDTGAKPYFEKLAVMSYFIIGALKETNLKIADIAELNGWFVDKRRRGFQIDGITKASGNVPTGHEGDKRQNEFLVTPEELTIRYRDVLKDPNRTKAIHGDLTAMVSFTTLLYTSQEHESLLKQFTIEKNRQQKTQQRMEIDQEMLESDLERFAFDPEYDVYSSGFSLNVKQLIYRFPSIILQDTAIIAEACRDDSWNTLDSWPLKVDGSNDGNSFVSQLSSLLAVACYARLRCYLHLNAGDNPFRIARSENQGDEVQMEGKILQFKQDKSVWEMAREEFLELAKLIINLQQHLLSCQTSGFSKENLRVAVSTPVDGSNHALLLAHYFCCEWCLVLMEIPGATERIQSLSGSSSFKTRVGNAIAFSYQQCRLHTEALQWYKLVSENTQVLTNKQLLSVYRGIAKCHLERSEISEANAAFKEALKLCGMQDVDSENPTDLTNGTECLDFGMVLLEAGCFNYKTEKNSPLALRLLFLAMEQLILSAANVKEDKYRMLAYFDSLTYSKRLMFASNPSRPLAHCLFALSELLRSVNSEFAAHYFQKAHQLGLKMVVDKDVDDIKRASILQNLGKQTRKQKYLDAALLVINQRVPIYAASNVKCEVLLSLGELAASPECRQEVHTEPELEEEERELDELIATIRTDEEVVIEQEDRWTRESINDWFLKTTATLEGVYKKPPHVDKANAHKIHADLLATCRNHTKEAMESYEMAKTAFKEVGSKLGVAAVAQSQANILRTVQDDREAAEKLYTESQEILEDTFEDQRCNSLLVKVQEERAENLRSLNRVVEAEKLTLEAEGMKLEIEKTKDEIKTEIRSVHIVAREFIDIGDDPTEETFISAGETPDHAHLHSQEEVRGEAGNIPEKLAKGGQRMPAEAEHETEIMNTETAGLHETLGSIQETEHTITGSEGATGTADESPFSDKPELYVGPTNMRLVREVFVDGRCTIVCNYENQSYVGLMSGAVVRIGPDYKVTPFIKLSDRITGMTVNKGKVYTTQRGNPQTVSVHELSTGRLLHSWTHTDNGHEYGSNLAIVEDEVVIADRSNKRLSVYSLTGQLNRHIPYPRLDSWHVTICSADTPYLIVLTFDGSSKVEGINIFTGKVIWTYLSDISLLGVTPYNQYVLAIEASPSTNIHILDINTGYHVGEIMDSKQWAYLAVYSLHTAGDTLIIPRDDSVLFYKLE